MVVADKKKEEKDTQITQNKKKQRMKTDKKNAEIFYIFLVSNPIYLLYIHLYIVVVVVVVAVIV